MHELSIAQMVVHEVVAVAHEHPGARVRTVQVRVGALRAVDPASLEFCYEASAIGTRAEGSKLRVAVAPIEATCRACDAKFSVQGLVFICPECGHADCDTTGGEELLLDWIDFDDPPAPARRSSNVIPGTERARSARRSQP